MYTLYCLDGSRATAAQMVLAEAGLPFEKRVVDITANEHQSTWFLSINPRGTIPALVDDHGNVVCETIAIMVYLCDRHSLEHLAPGPTDPQRGMMLDWLAYHATEVQEPVKRSFYAHRYTLRAGDIEAIRKRASDLFTQRWALAEDHLAKAGPYHLGERFSLPDIYLLVTSTYSKDLARGEFPAIDECVRRTASRQRIAPILDTHLRGLDRIVAVGVPQ
jgi:glutathione S-transferase